MNTTKLNIIRDIGGIPSYTLQQSTLIYTGKLTAHVAQSVVAPTDALSYMVRIGASNGGDIFVSVNGAAVMPTGAPSTSTTELNIAQTYVAAGGTVSIITDTDGICYSLGFYAIT